MRISDWSSYVCSSDLEPSASGTRPAATAAPDPDEEPPVTCARFQGFRAGGQGRSNEGPACAISCVASLPRDRTSVVLGKSVSVRVDCGGRRIITTKNRRPKGDETHDEKQHTND